MNAIDLKGDLCTAKVSTFLKTTVRERAHSFDLNLNNSIFNVMLYPEIDSSEAVAINVCNQYLGASTGSHCTAPVRSHIQKSIDNWLLEKTLAFVLYYNEKYYDVSLLPEFETSLLAANKFCGNDVNCLQPVRTYFQEAIDAWELSKTLDFTVNLNGQQIQVKNYLPEREKAAIRANTICTQHSNLLTEQQKATMGTSCIEPLADYIRKEVQNWFKKQAIELELTIFEKDRDIVYMPYRHNFRVLAINVCDEEASTSARAVSDNDLKLCYSSLTKLLYERLEQWKSGMQQSLPQ